MGAAGDELAFDQTQPAAALQRLIERDAGLGALLRGLGDIDAVFLRVLEQLPLEPSARRTRRAVDDAQIPLVDLTVLDLLVEDSQSLRIFRGDDDAAGIAVDSVAQGGGKGVLLQRPPFALGVEIGLDMVDERAAVFRAVVRVDGLARLFVDQQDVFILIDDVQLRRSDGQIGIFFFGGIKKLVVDVYCSVSPAVRRVSRSARLPLSLTRLRRMYFCASEAGSRGTALARKRSSRCPASFWVIVNSFMAVLTSPILFCAYFTTRPGSCKESAAAEKERKICEKVFDFHAIIRYNIHRTIMDWRALCCWI